MDNKELAENSKKGVFQFLLDLDRYLFRDEGPNETFYMFLSTFGYEWSSKDMEKIVPTGVFSEKELEILFQIEKFMIQLQEEYYKSGAEGWAFLSKDEYLHLKGLSYEYLRLIQESKKEW
ncbi:MAG TPA: hypothetical protein PK006_13515 [Saprospiraceae bacterium]|nr:hypothetical protein [Saprospiraceae bacterium]